MPAKSIPLPVLPDPVQEAPERVAVLPFPEASDVVGPDPSENGQYATKPLGGGGGGDDGLSVTDAVADFDESA